MHDRLFYSFSELVYHQCGINLHEGKKALLQARLNKRLRATGISSYEDYFAYVTSPENGAELVHFLDSVSTNLTYFFRESQHFDFLTEVAMPALIEEKRKEKSSRIRVWSAGCSTGEEPYSLAMCILAALDSSHKWDFRILATDISTKVLEFAAKGVYSDEKIQKVPQSLRSLHFHKSLDETGRNQYRVAELLKRIVTFRRLNLKEPFPFKGPFDYVFLPECDDLL